MLCTELGALVLELEAPGGETLWVPLAEFDAPLLIEALRTALARQQSGPEN